MNIVAPGRVCTVAVVKEQPDSAGDDEWPADVTVGDALKGVCVTSSPVDRASPSQGTGSAAEAPLLIDAVTVASWGVRRIVLGEVAHVLVGGAGCAVLVCLFEPLDLVGVS